MRPAPLILVVALAAGCSADPGDSGAPQSATSAAPPVTAPTTTFVPAASQPWAVIVVGDFGIGSDAEYAVAAAAREWATQHPETLALVTTGDNFYIADVAAAWQVPYGWVAATGLEVWATPGNHDIEAPGQWQASIDAFGSFPRWRTRVAGGVTFLLLDSNQASDASQHAWIEQVIGGLQGEPWVAVFHHPLVSCGGHAREDPVAAPWGLLLGSARLVLNGHDHNYQRFAGIGTPMVITGGGGQALHGIGACPPGGPNLMVGVAAHHFVTVEGSGDTAVVSARRPDGVVIDRFLVDLSLRP